jgi:hypothetical protein
MTDVDDRLLSVEQVVEEVLGRERLVDLPVAE